MVQGHVRCCRQAPFVQGFGVWDWPADPGVPALTPSTTVPLPTSLKPITKECTANDRTANQPLSVLPQIRALGRHRGRNPLPLFWTASGAELLFTGSELWFQLECDYTEIEPWVSIELNGAWIARQALTPGRNRVCAFRGMTPGTPKHVRLLNDVQPMQQDPTHFCS